MEIPKRLCDVNNRFCLILYKQKKPFEKNWQSTTNYKFNDEKLLTHTGNIGFCTGFNNIIVIDFDKEDWKNKLLPYLRKTFTVKTGSGGLHLYYKIDYPDSFKILDDKKETILDFQGKGKQVVCAGSTHPNGKEYEVLEDNEIAEITLGEIKAIFSKVFPIDYLPQDWKDNLQPAKFEKNSTVDEIKRKYKIMDLLSESGINTNKNPTQCPFHSSKGGKCFSFKDDVFNCFHCGEKGDVLTLYQKIHNVDFKTALNELCEQLNIEFKLISKPKEIKNNQLFKQNSKNVNFYEVISAFMQHKPILFDLGCNFWMWNIKLKKYEMVDETTIFLEFDKYNNDDLFNLYILMQRKLVIETFKRAGRDNFFNIKQLGENQIQFKDGIYDINDGSFSESSPEYFSTNVIPFEIGQNEETPNMDRILTSWVGEKYLSTLYEIIAYCTYRGYPIQICFVLTGSGSNGKSKFLNLVNKFIGNDNVVSSSFGAFESRFETAKLYKKLVCVMGETNYKELQDTAKFKQMTGEDKIDYEFKNKQGFSDYNYAKIIIATNSMPISFDNTKGFYRRWFFIDFPNEFANPKDVLAEIPEKEYNNLAFKILPLIKKLVSDRKFTNQGSFKDQEEKYIANSNPLLIYLGEFYEKNELADVNADVFYNSFCKYCIDKKKRTISRTMVYRMLTEHGFYIERKNIKGNNEEWVKRTYITGIKKIG